MEYKIGDLVTRNSYGNDLIFKIEKIEEDLVYLKGKNIRLCADATKEDLKKCESKDLEEDFIEKEKPIVERNEYFYLPGKILHIDAEFLM